MSARTADADNPQPDVVIVGAGLAGLACALRLADAGRDVLVLEKEDRPGGRVRTDAHQGFLLDRGFQVFLTGYPEARRLLDYRALDLRPFDPGALIWLGDGFHRVGDPLRWPAASVSTVRAPIGSFSDKLRIVRLALRLRGTSIERVFERPERSTAAHLDALGFSDRIREAFFQPFFGGVFLDDELETSSRMFEFVFKMFAEGRAALPSRGMEAIPAQLAERLGDSHIRCSAAVVEVESGRVRVQGGEEYRPRATVLAVGPAEAAALQDIDPPSTHATVCQYFTVPRSPIQRPILVLNGTRHGPINLVAPLSRVCHPYAPPGHELLSVTIRGSGAERERDSIRATLGQLTEWYGDQVHEWKHLRTYRVAHALPAMPRIAPADPRLRAGLYACGDYRQDPSIQGALLSGRRAAEVVLDDLR